MPTDDEYSNEKKVSHGNRVPRSVDSNERITCNHNNNNNNNNNDNYDDNNDNGNYDDDDDKVPKKKKDIFKTAFDGKSSVISKDRSLQSSNLLKKPKKPKKPKVDDPNNPFYAPR